MRVALVHDWLTGMRGGEKCLEALCRIWPQADIYTLLHRRGAVSPTIASRVAGTSFLHHIPGIERHYRWWVLAMPTAIRRLRLRDRYDVVISLSHAVAKGIAVPPDTPHICYCFTPMRWAWHCYEDYFGRRDSVFGVRGSGSGVGDSEFGVCHSSREPGNPTPDTRSPVPDLLIRPLIGWMRRWDRTTAQAVTHFVAISQTVQARIRECYGRPSTVIYPPVDTDFYQPAPVPREPFYLCVSALVPYKRIDLAIEACNRLRAPLVVIGSGPQYARWCRLAGPTVRLLGWQPDAVVRDYLRRCRALLFPGKEDFGIVPVEAQACGTPIIAYGEGGATETLLPASLQQPGTGLTFSPQTPEPLASAIQYLERHPECFCPRLARAQAERFTTTRFQDQMAEYVQRVVQDSDWTARRSMRFDTPHRERQPRPAARQRRVTWPLALLLIIGLAQPPAATALDLDRLNRCLAGHVADFTQNHGGDYRVWSDALSEPRDLYVYLPPGFSRERTYPLVVWLHGYGGDERQFLKQAVRSLDRAIVHGELPPVIAAAPDGSLRGDFWLWGHGSWFTNSRNGRFEDYLIQDVLPFLDHQFPVNRHREARVVTGWSMGGFAAYKIGMRYPRQFKILAGVYPNLNMRWCDTEGHYHTDFEPEIAAEMERIPRWKLFGIVPNIYTPVTFGWAVGRVWGHGPDATARLSQENPVELLDLNDVQPGQFDMLIAYGKRDAYNVDAQVESFLYRARQRGLTAWVRYHPDGHHSPHYVLECLPDMWREIGVRLRRNGAERLADGQEPRFSSPEAQSSSASTSSHSANRQEDVPCQPIAHSGVGAAH